MSFCPVCDELTLNKDVLSLGCGHVLCGDCLSRIQNTDKIKECPFCKRQIFSSEIRKIYINEINEELIDDHEKEALDNQTLFARLTNQKLQNDIIRQQFEEYKENNDIASEEAENLRLKNAEDGAKYKQLRTRYENVKNEYRLLQKEYKLLKRQVEEATDYSEARKWMEDHLQGIENLVSSTEEDKSSTRRLAVVLLTIREKYQRDLQKWEKNEKEIEKLKLDCRKKDELIKSLQQQCNELKSQDKEDTSFSGRKSSSSSSLRSLQRGSLLYIDRLNNPPRSLSQKRSYSDIDNRTISKNPVTKSFSFSAFRENSF